MKNYLKITLLSLSSLLNLDLNYFIKGGIWSSLPMVTSTIGGLFLSIIFARNWPTDVFGQYSFLITVVSFVGLTALPGLSQVITQEIAKNKDGVYLDALKMSLKWSLIGTFILFLGFIYFIVRQNPNLAIAFLVTSFAFPLTYGLNLFPSFFLGKKDFRNLSLFTIIAQTLPIGFTILALFKFPSLYYVALFSFWSSGLINLILTLISLRFVKNKKSDKPSIHFGKKLSFANIISSISDYLDRFLVPLLLGFDSNAIYAFATLLPLQIHNFYKIFLTLAQPKIATLPENRIKKDVTKKAIQLETLIIISVILYILVAPILFKFLYPAYKDSATFYSQLFSLSLLYFPSNLYGIASIRARNSKSIYLSNSVFALATILPMIVLIPLFGITGAIISKILTRITLTFFSYYIFSKLFH